jgi:hypothetical protein
MAALAILTDSNAAWSLPITFLIFDGVFASWYNPAHIALAMPDDWERYRAEVRDRRFRHQPHVARTATLHFPDAGRDSRVLAWLKRRVADRLEIQIAPAPPSVQRQRIVYASSDPDLDAVGIAAFGRPLEHLGGFPAFVGWLLRLLGANHSSSLSPSLFPCGG